MCMRRPTVSLHAAGKKRDKLKCNFPNMRMHCMINGNGIKKKHKSQQGVFLMRFLTAPSSSWEIHFPYALVQPLEVKTVGAVSHAAVWRGKASPRAHRNVVQPAC